MLHQGNPTENMSVTSNPLTFYLFAKLSVTYPTKHKCWVITLHMVFRAD